MILRIVSIVLYVISGFFFYMVCLLGFISAPSLIAKWGIMIGFSIPAVVALCVGLWLRGFANWKRDSGIILISASGFTAFLVFSMACLFMSDEFQRILPPDSMRLFGSYLMGSAAIISFAALGLFLVKTNNGDTGIAEE